LTAANLMVCGGFFMWVSMNILLTNDDGIDASGLVALAARLEEEGHQVWVVAPDRERSAQSHALTMHHALRAQSRGEGRWAVSGTPADCVYLALHGLLPGRPDVLVSGINRGANLGNDVHYSGTVAGAREGCLNGIPSLSVSLHIPVREKRHWTTAAELAVGVLAKMGKSGLPEGVFLNLNVPNGPSCKGIRVCGLGPRHYEPLVSERQDPRGRSYFWIGGPPRTTEAGQGTDVSWVSRGFASLTPLTVDATATDSLEGIRALVE